MELKKIRGEFLSETEANSAMEKISPYCGYVKITYSGGFDPGYGHNSHDDYIPDAGFTGFPEMGSFGIGGFGMISNLSFSPYGLTDQYVKAFPHSHTGYSPSGRATLEADVAEDNYEYVREKLYSLGAITVS